jgi:hypothetical protein
MLPRSRHLKALLALAVVVAVMLIVHAMLSSRRDEYLRRAGVCAQLERGTIAREESFRRFAGDDYPDALQAEMIEAKRSPEATRAFLSRLAARRAWAAVMRARYERAAQRPWLPVEVLSSPE